MISENCIKKFRQNAMFFRQEGKLVVNSDDMTTDQKHWIPSRPANVDTDGLRPMIKFYLCPVLPMSM